jgi:hypothetical protein
MREKNSKNADLNQLPLYQCHKKVRAIKIKRIEFTNYNQRLIPEDSSYAPIYVSSFYMQKHSPEVGGYFVLYEDGYQSFSPAKAFEEGYSLLGKIINYG